MSQDNSLGLSVIGQISVTVQDLDRAVEFYRDQLGMQFLFRVPRMAFSIVRASGSCSVFRKMNRRT